MKPYRKGIEGENKVACYFEECGYEILERRFRSRLGEVDIIARQRDVIVFIEVKTWDALGMESLKHSIDSRKRVKIKETASIYLYHHPEFSDCRIRFDLVLLSRKMEILNHWDYAF